jgi:hypothetical protein
MSQKYNLDDFKKELNEKIHELNEKIQERYINPEYFNSDEKEQLNEKIQEKDFLDEKINEITFSFSLEDLVSINKMELKKYVNSDDFTPDKFQILNNNVQKYIVLLFNSKKAIEYLCMDINSFLKDKTGYYNDNENDEDVQLSANELLKIKNHDKNIYALLLLRSLKSTKLTNDFSSNFFYFLKSKNRIKKIQQIILKMIRIHSDSNLTFPEDKVKIKVNPVILNFFSSGFTKKEITQELKTEIGKHFYKHISSYSESKSILKRLTLFNRKISEFKIKNDDKLNTVEKIIQLKKDKYSIREPYFPNNQQGNSYYLYSRKLYLKKLNFIENEATLEVFPNTTISKSSTSNSLKSNSHLQSLYKEANFDSAEDLPSNHLGL